MFYYVFAYYIYKYNVELVVKSKIPHLWLEELLNQLENYQTQQDDGSSEVFSDVLLEKQWKAIKYTNATSVYLNMEDGYRADFKDLEKSIITPKKLIEKYPSLIRLEQEELKDFNFNKDMTETIKSFVKDNKQNDDNYYFDSEYDFDDLDEYLKKMCIDIDRFYNIVIKHK